ncbi:hypothetical protein Hamer_G000766, partial [Homarus americanus]
MIMDLLVLYTKEIAHPYSRLSAARYYAISTTSVVIDGAAIIQMLKRVTDKNFDDYAHQVSIPYLSSQLKISSRLDLLWDRNSKSNKSERGEHTSSGNSKNTVLGNWLEFLSVESKKTELSSCPEFSSSHLIKRATS